MSSEAALRAWVRAALAPVARVVRIENGVEPGTPDVYFSGPVVGRGWLELKHVPRWPARAATPCRVSSLTREQATWLEDERRHAGRAWLLIQIGRDRRLLDGSFALRLLDGMARADFDAASEDVGEPMRLRLILKRGT